MENHFYVKRNSETDLIHKTSDKPNKKVKFKYIKKKKVNGKWRYYYDIKDALGFDESKDYDKAKKSNTKAANALKNATIKRDLEIGVKKVSGERLTTKDRVKLEKYSDNVDKQIKKQSKVAKEYSKAKKDFEKTPLGFLKITMPEKMDEGKDWVKKKLGIKETKKSDKPEKISHSKLWDMFFNTVSKQNGDKNKVKLPNGKIKVFDKIDEYKSYLSRLFYQKTEPKFMKKILKIPADKIFKTVEDMDKVNETYNPYDPKTSQNCANCSVAYELRRRGYDVEAKDNGGDWDYNGAGYRFYDYFKNADVLCVNGDGSTFSQNEKFARKIWGSGINLVSALVYKKDLQYAILPQNYTPQSIEKAIAKNNPPGSRGMIDVEWKAGGAHSIVYEVDSTGKVTIRDSQTYDEYTVDELASRVKKVRITRTDNLQLKEGILDAVVPNEDRERNYFVNENITYRL